MALLKSLASERDRWDTGSEAFKSQMSTIVGDVLLSSAFMAYAGQCQSVVASMTYNVRVVVYTRAADPSECLSEST